MYQNENWETVIGDLIIERHGTGLSRISGSICTNSQQVSPGDIFAAIPGTRMNGNDFIPQAVSNGALTILHTKELNSYEERINYIRVCDIRAAVSRLHRCANSAPDKDLKIFGFTGTNGKTTSAYLLRHLLNHSNIPCGLVSTVEYDNGAEKFPPTHTTPDPQTLFPLLRSMKENNLRAAAMEFSSHALGQHRVDGISVAGAVFTNLTGDHLDFHHDMDSYFEAKKHLFTDLLIPGGSAVINIDDPYGRTLAKNLPHLRPDINIVTFGRSVDAVLKIINPSSHGDGCSFLLTDNKDFSQQLSLPLPGHHNIYNLAGVAALLYAEELPLASLTDAFKSGSFAVPGRLELLTSPSGAKFYVDYAHTADALTNVLSSLRPVCRGRLIVVFGAGGERDKSKRPKMGRAAADNADILIITSDNPRSETPEAIISEIVSGIPAGSSYFVETDRRTALQKAAKIAVCGDMVVVAGKGHENYQEINGIRYPFDDREILRGIFAHTEC